MFKWTEEKNEYFLTEEREGFMNPTLAHIDRDGDLVVDGLNYVTPSIIAEVHKKMTELGYIT